MAIPVGDRTIGILMSPQESNLNPYDAPASGPRYDDVGQPSSTLDRFGRITILGAILYMLVYFPYFFVQLYRMSKGVDVPLLAIAPAHFLGMALNFAALIMTIRDLYLRSFPNPNSKATWLLLILLTGGIGWIAYVFKYALKPRIPPEAA
jgi:hypothetical protein